VLDANGKKNVCGNRAAIQYALYSCIGIPWLRANQPNSMNMRNVSMVISILLLAGCSQQTINLKDEEESILKSWIDWEEKGKTGDPELAAFYWAEDAVIMGPGQPTIKGKKQIQNILAGMNKIPGFKMTWDERPSSIEISKDGQMAYLLAKNEVNMTESSGTTVTNINQALQIWKKDNDGNWKAAVVVIYPTTSKK
jgi:ketosteroid isomerase-like protein